MYLGIVRLKVHSVFTVLSFMLIFLAAGMAGQSANFLTSAGFLPEISGALWDTSTILSERSFAGQFLHILFGYTSRPNAMHLLWYLATLGATTFLFFWVGRRELPIGTKSVAIAGLLLAFTLGVRPVYAVDKVYSPVVHAGEFEIEDRGTWYFDDGDEDNKIKNKLGVGYGFTDSWASEAYFVLEKEEGDSSDITSINWENRFELTEQGEYWWDLGMYLEGELATQGREPDVLEAKLLLENNVNRVRTLVNFIFEQQIGGHREEDLEGELALNSRYRLNSAFEPGIEWQSEFGELNDIGSYSEQEHFFGPALFGKVAGHWKYELAYLFGVSSAAPDGTLRWVLEYEFPL